MIGERASDPAAYASAVRAACERDVPLGAYATAEGIAYLFLAGDGAYALRRALDAERTAEAIAPAFPLFAWDEREMADTHAIRFAGIVDARPFFADADGAMPAARTARGTGVVRFVVGPVHAGIIEPGRFTFSSGGETVVHLDAQLGYGHRGVERALEGRDAIAAAPLVARICGGCSVAHAYAYALALERLAGVALPPAVDLARLAVAELERLHNHLGDLAAAASAAAWAPGFARGMALKERLMRVLAEATGHRLGFDAIVPGGVGRGVAPDRVAVGELSALERDVDAYLRAAFANTSLVSRWHDAGRVSSEAARALGAVGPGARGSGATLDIRAFAPYGAYRERRFVAPSEHGGDVFARATVKAHEVRASFGLVADAIATLRDADPLPPAAELTIPHGTAIGVVEGPRGAETIAVETDGAGALRRLHLTSASYRNWPIVARAMDGNIVPDFPLVNKSFNLCYACVDR